MFSSALAEKITAVLRHDADALAQVGQRGSRAMGTPSSAPRPPWGGVVEAQQQLEHRALAGAAGAHQRHRLARRTCR
jgi:hypothetical protein